jgi:CheY-like chemotaxis protein
MFDTFAQEDASSTKRHGGSGLGLAVAKQIIDLSGGTISVNSKKNVGSVFTVTLPLEPAAPEKTPDAPDSAGVPLAGRRVLIVEDIAENAEILADLLELEGVETEHAENGQIGLEMFSASPPGYYDAIMMDMRMPVMDGLEATRRIRALERADAKRIPIIAVTANAFESDIKASLDAGMNVHLAKPADSDMLYGTLRRQLAHAAQTERRSE